MKRVFKILGYTILDLVVIALLTDIFFFIKWNRTTAANMKLLSKEAPTLTYKGYQYRDLNKNGQLDTYEDSRAAIGNRINDLDGQMNLEEKAGLMFITMIGVYPDGTPQEKPLLNES